MSKLGTLVYDDHFKNTHILVYMHKDATLLGPYADEFVRYLVENPVVTIFRKIEIVFRVNPDFQKGMQEGLHQASKENIFGHVVRREVEQGINRIYIWEDVIFERARKKYQGKITEPSQLGKKVINHALIRAKKTAVHELTHLWHLRTNRTKDLVKKRHKKLYETQLKLIERNELFPTLLESALHDSWYELEKRDSLVPTRITTTLTSHWTQLRDLLLEILEDLVYEGMAMFCEELGHQVTFTEESGKHWYNEALKSAENLDFRTRMHLERIEQLIETIYSKEQKSKKKIEDEVREIKRTLKFLETSHRKFSYYPYTIGPHLYQFILMARENLDILDVMKYDYSQLIKMYEDTCRLYNLEPVVSLHSGEGVFSYGAYVAELNRLRKKAQKLATS